LCLQPTTSVSFAYQIKACKHFRDTFCLSKSQKAHKKLYYSHTSHDYASKGRHNRNCSRVLRQRRTRASSKESACATWDEADNPESGSGSLTLTAMSRLSE